MAEGFGSGARPDFWNGPQGARARWVALPICPDGARHEPAGQVVPKNRGILVQRAAVNECKL